MYADATFYIFLNTYFIQESLGPKYGNIKRGNQTVNYDNPALFFLK